MSPLKTRLCLFSTSLLVIIMSSSFVNAESSSSTIDRNEMGMGILYDMVNIFLGDVVHKEKITNAFFNLSNIYVDGKFKTEEFNDWEKWAKYLIGFAVCAAIGIAFIVIMPIVGIIFCCCRLCGNCGARPGKNTQKHTKCKRRSYCTVLTILTTIALAGVVCAFVCNSLVYKNLQNDSNNGALGNINKSFDKIEQFIDSSISEVSNFVDRQFNDTSQKILSRIKISSNFVVDSVLKFVHVEDFLNVAVEISIETNKTKQRLDDANRLLDELVSDSNVLQNNLTEIKDDIISFCNKSSTQCSSISIDTSGLNMEANFGSLNKLTDESANISKALDLHKQIEEANQTLTNVKASAKGSIDKNIKDAEDVIGDIQRSINNEINKLRNTENDLFKGFDKVHDGLDDANKSIREYSKYAYYGVIGVCCAYLLIVVLYYIGLLFGICGERAGDGAPCCNKGCGANFLLSGVGLTFIFSSILMLICAVLFIVGGATYTEVCRYFEDHDTNNLQIFDDLIYKVADLQQYNNETDFSVSGIIRDCKENKALYTALKLDNIFHIDKALDLSNLNKSIDDLMNTNYDFKNISIEANLSKPLDALVNSGLQDVNFTMYLTELSKQLVKGNLSKITSDVDSLAKAQSDATDKAYLETIATRLNTLKDNDVPQMQQKVDQLHSNLTELQNSSKILNNAGELIKNLTISEHQFNVNKTILIQKAIRDFIKDVLGDTVSSVNTLKDKVREDMCRCQNLSSALYTITDAGCIQILDPVNGLWFSFGWCLFFFVPCLIFAILLAGQYRRTLDDNKDYDDQNYIMYGGPNPDTIPLTSVDRRSGSSSYLRSGGMMNAGYRDESKKSYYADQPPPYNAHSGIAAYAPPKDQHQWQAKVYPAHNGDGFMGGNGANSSYSYPY